MPLKSLFITTPCQLSLKQAQLLVHKHEQMPSPIPIEDLGWVVIEHPQVRLSAPLLGYLAEQSVAVLFCNQHYMPSGCLLPLEASYQQRGRHDAQLRMSQPLKKRLWQRIIQHKIAQQARLLEQVQRNSAAQTLRQMAKRVQSGDPQLLEAQAAKAYWFSLFGLDFSRKQEGPPPNPALNYGYALLRAAMARALAGQGLINTLGLHHHNRYNAFCLADDLMEPYRPFIDQEVYHRQEHYTTLVEGLDQASKKNLIELLHSPCQSGEGGRTLLCLAIKQTASTLGQCIDEHRADRLRFASLL